MSTSACATPSRIPSVARQRLLSAIALHGGDMPTWQRIGGRVRLAAQAMCQRLGQPLPGLPDIHLLPAGALPALARSPEPEPIDAGRLATCLNGAFALLAATWPDAERELRYFMLAIVSGRMPAGHQSSGSSTACPFVVRIDFCIDDPLHLLADAMVHEAAHVKLRLSGAVQAFCDVDDTPRHRHPWRADLRPLSALLVACHAFVAVHGFHARRRRMGIGDALAIEVKLRLELSQALATLRAADGLTAKGFAFAALLDSTFDSNCRLVDGHDDGVLFHE